MSCSRRLVWLQQVRGFSRSTQPRYPLQPQKQRKTIPIRNPRRPHLPDPIETDPTAQRFKLSDHPEAMLVIREPSGMAHLLDDLSDSPASSTSPPAKGRLAKPSPSLTENQLALSHPVLATPPNQPTTTTTTTTTTTPSATPPPPNSSSYRLPPPLRKTIQHPNSLTPETLDQLQNLRPTHSLTQLSNKFGVSRLLISMLGPKDKEVREQVQIKDQMRLIRKQSRWSVAKSIKRQEKIIRRSFW